MFILRGLGEGDVQRSDFSVNRPEGTRHHLVLFLHTGAELLCNGSWQRVPPGTAVVFRPWQPQCYRAVGESYRDSRLWAEIPPSVLQEDFPFGTPITLHNPQQYQALLHLMCTEFYSARPQREEIVHYMGLALIHMLGRETLPGDRSPLYDRLVQLRRELYKNPEKPWRAEELARAAAVSPGYLQRCYKRYFGISVTQDLIQARISAGAALLRATKMPVEAVAEACGYQYTEHFIRQFKQRLGMTPAQYRRGEQQPVSIHHK